MLELVGFVIACASAPNLNGAMHTMAIKGADSAKNSHSEVFDTTFTPATFSNAHNATTANPTISPRCPIANQGNSRCR